MEPVLLEDHRAPSAGQEKPLSHGSWDTCRQALPHGRFSGEMHMEEIKWKKIIVGLQMEFE